MRYFKENEKGVAVMCRAMEMLTNEAERRGMERGMENGKETERIFSIRSLMANLQLTAEKAMDALAIPKAEQERYKAML